ncbi:hypothetical protein P7C71_g343, partial [Lecanoromycetidae sp. Uapishka_2]
MSFSTTTGNVSRRKALTALCVFFILSAGFLLLPSNPSNPSNPFNPFHNLYSSTSSSAKENTLSTPSAALAAPAATQEHQAPWLIVTSSASHDFQRRLIIRWTWVSLFQQQPPLYDHAFGILRPDPALISLLKKENDTFGDILFLDHLEDNEGNAKGPKPFEIFKKVTQEGWKGNKKYAFVSKVDSDTYIDPVRVWDLYLKDRVHTSHRDGGEHRDGGDQLLMGMPMLTSPWRNVQGGFKTMSWDLATVLGELYDGWNVSRGPIGLEDDAVGRILTEADEPYKILSLVEEETWDIYGEEGELYAETWIKTPPVQSKLEDVEVATYLHQMKEERDWLAVKDLFDKDGWVPNRKSRSSQSTEKDDTQRAGNESHPDRFRIE